MTSNGVRGLPLTFLYTFSPNPSTLLYGHLLSTEKNEKITTWINDVTNHRMLADASTPIPRSVKVYQDWLYWLIHDAISLLSKLDKFERRFRIAGFKYHRISHELRHSSTLVHGSKIERSVLTRLSQLFETNEPRSLQPFFKPWLDIYKTASKALRKLESHYSFPEDSDFLRKVNQRLDIEFSLLSKPLRILENTLLWLEEAVARVVERSKLDGSEALSAKHSREGGLLRLWIHSFLEIEHRVVKVSPEYVEYYVDRVLDIGVEEERYWSMLVLGPAPPKKHSA